MLLRNGDDGDESKKTGDELLGFPSCAGSKDRRKESRGEGRSE